MTPVGLVKGAVIAFVPLAAVAALWPIITNPARLAGLLRDEQGQLSIGRIQVLIASFVSAAWAASGADGAAVPILSGLSHAGFLSAKFIGFRNQADGDA